MEHACLARREERDQNDDRARDEAAQSSERDLDHRKARRRARDGAGRLASRQSDRRLDPLRLSVRRVLLQPGDPRLQAVERQLRRGHASGQRRRQGAFGRRWLRTGGQGDRKRQKDRQRPHAGSETGVGPPVT